MLHGRWNSLDDPRPTLRPYDPTKCLPLRAYQIGPSNCALALAVA